MNHRVAIAGLPGNVEELEDRLSEPTPYLVEAMRALKGDVIILGAGGKMGPTLTRMVSRAADEAGGGRKVTAVSRFSLPREKEKLDRLGIQTIAANLLDPVALEGLPECPLVIYMAGMKFGATGNEPLTWAMNTFLPGMVCRKFSSSRIAAFSTGNVYGLSPAMRGGSRESDSLAPQGEYAMSCLGRERMFQHFSQTLNLPTVILRLNYAVELRYGVLTDIAAKVWRGDAVDVAMGCFNVLWQRDANAMAIAALLQADSPATILNLAGPEVLSVRSVAQQFGQIMGREPIINGAEASDALLGNAQAVYQYFGYPTVNAGQLIEWTARWVMQGGESLGKPTHFESRDGRF